MGTKGCRYLSKGSFESLTYLGLGTICSNKANAGFRRQAYYIFQKPSGGILKKLV